MGKLPTRTYRAIFLEDWLDIIEKCDRAGCAKAAKVDISYINNMIGGRKRNPSAHVLLAISEYLGITVNDLYRRPRLDMSLEHLREFSQEAIAILLKHKR